jgi:hypothetical protein
VEGGPGGRGGGISRRPRRREAVAAKRAPGGIDEAAGSRAPARLPRPRPHVAAWGGAPGGGGVGGAELRAAGSLELQVGEPQDIGGGGGPRSRCAASSDDQLQRHGLLWRYILGGAACGVGEVGARWSSERRRSTSRGARGAGPPTSLLDGAWRMGPLGGGGGKASGNARFLLGAGSLQPPTTELGAPFMPAGKGLNREFGCPGKVGGG